MKKEEYIKKLENLLKSVDSKEREAAIEYCMEYFEEARDKSEEEIVQELGSPEEFAKQILNVPKKHKKWPCVLLTGLVCIFLAFLLGIKAVDIEQEDRIVTETISKEYSAVEIQGDGNIFIQSGDTTSIEPKDVVVMKEDGGTLEIQILDKQSLKITLGKEIRSLDVENVTGSITLKNVDCESVNLSTESGTVEGSLAGSLDDYAYEIESEQGVISLNDKEYTGPIEFEEKALKERKLEVDCTSGQVHLVFKK